LLTSSNLALLLASSGRPAASGELLAPSLPSASNTTGGASTPPFGP